MSQFSCPLCGKHSSLDIDPESLDLDVQVLTKRGLGKGKGFAIVSRESILGKDSELCQKLARRTLQLVKMFMDEEVLPIYEVIEKLVGSIVIGSSSSEISELLKNRDYDMKQYESVYKELTDMKCNEMEKKRIDEILRTIQENISCKIVLDSESGYKLKLENLEELQSFITYFIKLEFNLGKKILKRIISDNTEIIIVLNYLGSLSREKSLGEKLVDYELSTLSKDRFPLKN